MKQLSPGARRATGIVLVVAGAIGVLASPFTGIDWLRSVLPGVAAGVLTVGGLLLYGMYRERKYGAQPRQKTSLATAAVTFVIAVACIVVGTFLLRS
jgi:xanthine/uracil permease